MAYQKVLNMLKLYFKAKMLLLVITVFSLQLFAQQNSVIENIVKDEFANSQLERLATELSDGIGPRLVGSPQMKAAHDWTIATYKAWGIQAENQQWGQWRGWQRGISHIDMISPWIKSMNGTQLAWSPQSPKAGVTAEVIILPLATDSVQFKQLLPQVKGKLVMISTPQPTGRPDDNWEKYARKDAFEKMKADRTAQNEAWSKRISNTGYNGRTLAVALENAGAAGIISSYWSRAYGANKIFGANTKKIPVVDISLEDYGLLYRLVEAGQKPKLRIIAESKELGLQPTFNTIATMRGSEKPDEYVVLSAHLDSWDGGTGATDNTTGTIIMMEVMRLLKKWYPNPKRTIIAGHWGSEEQGLNGSRAYVQDNPEIIKNIQAVFNQDGGTGRTNFINGAGFVQGYDFLGRWLSAIPQDIRSDIGTDFPGTPAGGGSDNASFVAAGVPAFYLGTTNWDYGTVTWHTNLDTYDKIVFDDLRRSTIVTAILAYMASEDPEKASREKRIPAVNSRGEQIGWPQPRDATRKGGID